MPSRVVDAIDAYQRRRRWVGFPLAVVYKFSDDQGPYLTALITYYGLTSLFSSLSRETWRLIASPEARGDRRGVFASRSCPKWPVPVT